MGHIYCNENPKAFVWTKKADDILEKAPGLPGFSSTACCPGVTPFLIIILMLAANAARGQTAQREEKRSASGEEEFTKLAKDYLAKRERAFSDIENVTDPQERYRLIHDRDPANTMCARFLALEKLHRGSTVGLSCLYHLAAVSFGSYGETPVFAEFPVKNAGRQALNILAVHYGDHPDLDTVFRWLCPGSSQDQAVALLTRASKSPHRHVRGTALLAMADLLSMEAEMVTRIDTNLELIGQDADEFAEESHRLKQLRAVLGTVDVEDNRREALQYYNEVVHEYADVLEAPRLSLGPVLLRVERTPVDGVTKPDRRPLAEIVEPRRNEITTLVIGAEAPEIAGPDAFGNELKLSDQRGKVVVLMFSFKGCGPCEAMYPDNRALIEAFSGRPLKVLGVMGDEDIATVKAAVEERKITWDVWWDGRQRGPLATQWNVKGWPEVFVLDHHGRIRYRELPHVLLKRAVTKLVEAAEKG